MCERYRSERRSVEVITAYTCDYLLDNEEGTMSLDDRFLPSVEEYLKAHSGKIYCPLIKVEIHVMTVLATPEEQAKYEQAQRESWK